MNANELPAKFIRISPHSIHSLCISLLFTLFISLLPPQLLIMFWSVLILWWNCIDYCMSWILNQAYESNYFMVLLSCSMATVAIVHLRTASLLISDMCGDATAATQPTPYHALPMPAMSYPKSPINILRPQTSYEKQVRQLHWNWYDQLPPAVLMENNGHTVIVRISCSPDSMPHLNGSDLYGNYYFVEAVFKWGTSEHRIDSRHYALEMQVLHASNNKNVPFEYLTVAYLFMVGRQKNPQLQQVVENLNVIRTMGSIIELPPFDLASLLQPFDRGYYSYRGSYSNGSIVLPTQWFICTRIFPVSSEQLLQFQTLCGPNGQRLMQNARSEQPLMNRRINFIH